VLTKLRAAIQRHNDGPRDEFHHQIGASDDLFGVADDSGDGEREKRGDRAEPAHRRHDVGCERSFPNVGSHQHDRL
jgi:hypothetical protein